MTATSARLLAALGVLALVVAFTVNQLRGGAPVDVPGYAPVTLLVLAGIEGYAGDSIRSRIHRHPRTRPVVPLAVARLAALAKATSPVGALAAGTYAGILLYALTEMDEIEAARDEVLTLVFGLVTAAGLTAAALFLESSCRTPPQPNDDEEEAAP